jgi:hypothetical protein
MSTLFLHRRPPAANPGSMRRPPCITSSEWQYTLHGLNCDVLSIRKNVSFAAVQGNKNRLAF